MKQFPPLKNDLFLRAARGEKTEKVPIWIMRQAGRYLPEFRAVRAEHDFFEICQTPDLACKVTLQPINKFDLDAAIIFSDILVIPQAMGMTVEMKPTVGPHFPNPLNTPDDIDRLETTVDVREKLGYVFDAITLTRHKLEGRVPLIGFTGAPWTLMSYMIEGGGTKTFSKSKNWLYKFPDASRRLLQMITDVIVDYLTNQVEAGAQALQVFESHAEILGPDLFADYSLPYLTQILQKVRKNVAQKNLQEVPMIVFAKGAHYALKELGQSGYDVVGLDWTIDPSLARNALGSNVTLQGNLDPCALYASKNDLEKMVRKMISRFGTQKYVANLGHGIYPDMDPENVANLIEAVHSVSLEMNEVPSG